MKTILSLSLLAALVSSGCQSSSFLGSSLRSSTPTVDEDILVYVPEANRSDITDARTERIKLQDSVNVAQRDIEIERQRISTAQDQLGIAEDGLEAAKRAHKVARESREGERSDNLDRTENEVENARNRWLSAKEKVHYHEARIAQLESSHELAELRVDLADARVELAKARAVSELDRPEARDVSVREFEMYVEEYETRLAMAEVDADAWDKKIELRQTALDDRDQTRMDGDRNTDKNRNNNNRDSNRDND